MLYALLSMCILFLSSCTGSTETPAAFGTFESSATTLSAQVGGLVISSASKEGRHVTTGDTLVVIDTVQLALKRRELAAVMEQVSSQSKSVLSQIAVLKEKLATQEKSLTRSRAMHAKGAATQKQLDKAEGEVRVTTQQIVSVRMQNSAILSEDERLKVQVAQLEDQLARSVVLTPFNGVILLSLIEEYELVAPGRPLLELQDLTVLRLKGYVTQPQLSSLRLGQEVRVEVDGATAPLSFTGSLSWISDRAEFTPKTVQTVEERRNLVYAIKVDVLNDGSLKIGMPATLFF